SAATIGGLLAAIAIRGPRDRWRRADCWLLLAPLLLLLILVAYGSWSYYRETAELYGAQGRYLLPAIVGVAVAFALGAGRLLGWAASALPGLMLAAVAALHGSAAYTVLTHYYYGIQGPVPIAERLRALLAWAPWPPSVVVATWVLAGAAAIWAAAEMGVLAWSGLRPRLSRGDESRPSPSRRPR
ncbi:MAG TPA: hypothetical protein VML96_13145, partial [Egibacteraceae bacterium]|nr:hypothetical protein [Egibacteraceae bacterium]